MSALERAVTDIRSHGRGSHRRTVWLDGDPWRDMPLEVLRELGLRREDVIDPEEIETRLEDLEPRLARERAFRLLQYRERSRDEVFRRLIDDGYREKIAGETVRSLTSSGLIDDGRFAEGFARTLVVSRGYGRARAFTELVRHGLDEDLVNQALEQVAPLEDEAARALALAVRLVKATDTPERLGARLVRRGFGTRVALDAARSVLEAAGFRDDSEDPA